MVVGGGRTTVVVAVVVHVSGWVVGWVVGGVVGVAGLPVDVVDVGCWVVDRIFSMGGAMG